MDISLYIEQKSFFPETSVFPSLMINNQYFHLSFHTFSEGVKKQNITKQNKTKNKKHNVPCTE